MQSFTSISFKTDNGLWHANGIAKLSSAGVVLEFESKLLGLVGGGVKEMRLPLAELLEVRFRKGVFKSGARIEIRTKSYAKLAELPNKDGKLTLKIFRDDFDRAKQAVARLQKDMTDHEASLPPTQTPVSSLFDHSEDETQKFGQE